MLIYSNSTKTFFPVVRLKWVHSSQPMICRIIGSCLLLSQIIGPPSLILLTLGGSSLPQDYTGIFLRSNWRYQGLNLECSACTLPMNYDKGWANIIHQPMPPLTSCCCVPSLLKNKTQADDNLLIPSPSSSHAIFSTKQEVHDILEAFSVFYTSCFI